MATLINSWNELVAGQRVTMLIETRGATADDVELTYPIGAEAIIEAAVDFGDYQGKGVHLTIGQGHLAICNSFDDRDVKELGMLPFQPK